MISRSDVVEGYLRFLEREPESEDVIALHAKVHRTVEAFHDSLRSSQEYLGRQPAAGQTRPLSNILTSKDLEDFIIQSDRLGPPGSPAVDAFWAGKSYRPTVTVDQSLDPFSEAYVAQQIAVYEEISGRKVDQQSNEMSDFRFEDHVDAPNAYAHFPAHAVALHMGRVARTVELAQLPSGASVLDMGCGWGVTSELMAFAGLRVTGIDINPRFVDLVNARAQRKGLAITGVSGTFEGFPGEDLYDAVLFYESLHHAVRPWTALESVGRRLKPGGKLMLSGEPVHPFWKNWGMRKDPFSVYCIRKFGWFESGWSESFLRACVNRCGFRIDHFAVEGGTIGWVMIASKA